ncbi:unnamed protein product [Mytilus edulis]|uniref:Uncharacterized protein n=1 Tax=Mytilus edulis TaxID=6550 RepID=A0A8S3U0P1_MYTED|nr:unnamed protein product [Mytilus edulis]
MRRLCPKLNLDKTTNIIPNTIIPIEMYCDNPYLDEKTLSKAELRQNNKYNHSKHHQSYRRLCPKLNLDKTKYNTLHLIPIEILCPKLNLDKTANIIPNTIIPIEMYCDNPYLDEKTLSKAELRENNKYNTKHHHSYRDRCIVTILTLMRRLCPKLNLDKTANIITHHHSYNPNLMRRLLSKAELRQNSNIIPNTIIPIETYCDNPYLDEKTLSKAKLRQNNKYNTKHHHSYRDVL